MSGKRISDSEQCWKIPHATRGQAAKQLKHLAKKDRRGNSPMHTYWCDICQAWHVGHEPRMNLKEARKAKARYAA